MSDSSTRLVAEISHALVEAWAPEEIELHGDLLEAFAKDQLFKDRRAKPDAMGMGIGDAFALSSMFSPLLIAVAEWTAKEIIGKSIAEFSVAEIKKRLQIKPAAGVALDGALQLKLADDLIDHLVLRGKALGIEDARLRDLCDQVSRGLIPLLASAMAHTVKS